MTSLQKLITFFKENHHDVVDYWYIENRIKWIKIISRKGGEIYFVNVYSFKFFIEESEELIERKARFKLIESVANNSFDYLWKQFQNNKNRFIFIRGNEISESENSFYTATNLPKISNLYFYLIIELEWFYENLFIVNSEIQRCYDDIFGHVRQNVKDLLMTTKSFLRDDSELNQAVSKLLIKSEKSRDINTKSRDLYKKVCKDETDYHIQIFKMDNAIDPNNMTFKASVERQYHRKKIFEKIEQLEIIKSALVQKINYSFIMKWNFYLQLMIITNNISQLIESIMTIIMDASNI